MKASSSEIRSFRIRRGNNWCQEVGPDGIESSDITNSHRVQSQASQLGVKVYAIGEKPIYQHGCTIITTANAAHVRDERSQEEMKTVQEEMINIKKTSGQD